MQIYLKEVFQHHHLHNYLKFFTIKLWLYMNFEWQSSLEDKVMTTHLNLTPFL